MRSEPRIVGAIAASTGPKSYRAAVLRASAAAWRHRPLCSRTSPQTVTVNARRPPVPVRPLVAVGPLAVRLVVVGTVAVGLVAIGLVPAGVLGGGVAAVGVGVGIEGEVGVAVGAAGTGSGRPPAPSPRPRRGAHPAAASPAVRPPASRARRAGPRSSPTVAPVSAAGSPSDPSDVRGRDGPVGSGHRRRCRPPRGVPTRSRRNGPARIVLVGSVGGLSPALPAGSLIVPDRAAGTHSAWMYHRGAQAGTRPDPGLAAALVRRLRAALPDGVPVAQGPTTTCETILAETADDVRDWSSAGFLGVEMEAALTFAIGHRFGVPAAAVLHVADTLVDQVGFLDPGYADTAPARAEARQVQDDVAVAELRRGRPERPSNTCSILLGCRSRWSATARRRRASRCGRRAASR